MLAAGARVLDSGTGAVRLLEECPLFNAGIGSVFTRDSRHELDACVMDGCRLQAGAVAGVQHLRNPVLAARLVLEKSPHVLLIGEGAENFAISHGMARVDNDLFSTPERLLQLQEAKAGGEIILDHHAAPLDERQKMGTVGAVALDLAGNLAAATSTGGMTNKRYGRVGDSPIIGAGTWADARCAVSGTGWGEYYIRAAAAHEVCARVRLAGHSLARAADSVINRDIPKAGGDGGAIALGADGSMAFPFNTEGMYRGWIGADGGPHVAIYKEDPLPAR